MPRIRSIKPQFWSDEKLAPLAPIHRLVFLGLMSAADDAGRVVDNVKLIDGYLFPESDDTARDSLELLAALGRLWRYTAENGQKVIQIVHWTRHQRIQHPGAQVLPPPPEAFLTSLAGESRERLMSPAGASQEVSGEVSSTAGSRGPAASYAASGEPHESLMSPAGGARETLSPDEDEEEDREEEEEVAAAAGATAGRTRSAPRVDRSAEEMAAYIAPYPEVARFVASAPERLAVVRSVLNKIVGTVGRESGRAYVATLEAALSGQHPPVVAPEAAYAALEEWFADGAQVKLVVFRRYLQRAATRRPDGAPPQASTEAAPATGGGGPKSFRQMDEEASAAEAERRRQVMVRVTAEQVVKERRWHDDGEAWWTLMQREAQAAGADPLLYAYERRHLTVQSPEGGVA